MLHAHIKIKNLVNGYTTRSAAEEMCSALSAVGECLSLFGWVVTFEVIGIVDSFTFGACCAFALASGHPTALVFISRVSRIVGVCGSYQSTIIQLDNIFATGEICHCCCRGRFDCFPGRPHESKGVLCHTATIIYHGSNDYIRTGLRRWVPGIFR